MTFSQGPLSVAYFSLIMHASHIWYCLEAARLGTFHEIHEIKAKVPFVRACILLALCDDR